MKLLLSYFSAEKTDAVVVAAQAHTEGLPDRLEIIRLLVDAGAPVSAYASQYADQRGIETTNFQMMLGFMTGLHWAAREGKEDLVGLLLELGADRTMRSFKDSGGIGETP